MSSPASALKLENVLYEKKGSIAYVTINRPKVLNALNAKTISELRSAFEDARDDSEVRGVVFTGAGDKAFAAGADISEMASDTPLTAEQKTRSGQSLTDLIENLGKPVIAAVNGFALGGGCELSMASTIRIAAETARFGQPEVKIGSARSQDRRNAGLWRNAASSQVDRQGPSIAADSVGRNHRRARSLSHRPGE